MATSTRKHPKPQYTKDLLLLFAIPLSIALIAAVVIYVPRLLANPTHDFVYASCQDYQCQSRFIFNDEQRLVEQPINSRGAHFYPLQSRLHYYDVSEGSSRQMTLHEAQQYTLDNSSKSPDGYMLKSETSDDGFLFSGGYELTWYLQNGIKRANLELSGGGYSSESVSLIGWVTQ